MTDNGPTDTASFDIANKRISALLDKLARKRTLCPCCVAHALLFQGVALMDEVKGSAETIPYCKEVIDRLHENDVPEPEDLSGTVH